MFVTARARKVEHNLKVLLPKVRKQKEQVRRDGVENWKKRPFRTKIGKERALRAWKMPGKVKVRVLAGRNLPVMDKSSDTSDAFVEVCYFVFLLQLVNFACLF